MDKRTFLNTALLAAAAIPSLASAKTAPGSARGPALLTVTGAIGRGNRGALDPALDLLMKKQGVKFDKAHAFDFAALAALPAVTIKPTLEYDAKPHTLSGPLLTDVVAAAGVPTAGKLNILLRAIDGYVITVPLDEVRKSRYIIATHIDGKPIPLGGLGPLWAVYDADRIPEIAAQPLNQRFAMCPWGVYHIEVVRAGT